MFFKKMKKKIIHFLLGNKLFKFFFSRFIYLILKNQIKSFDKNNINILALSSYRLRDLSEFENLKELNIFKLPIRLQYFLFYKFSSVMEQNKSNFFKNKKKFIKKQIIINKFLSETLDYSLEKLNFKIIFSGAAYYIQDAIFFSYFKKKNIKIVIIQRENLSFQRIQNNLIKKYFKDYQPSEADLILTQNKSTMRFMKQINFYKNSKILVSGALRMDNFISQIINKTSLRIKKEKKMIVFFSFTKNSGINITKNNSTISANENTGLVDFFYNSHNMLIDFFSKKQNCTLIIKHKFGFHFLDEIRKNWESYSGRKLPSNCILTSQANVHNLILSADIVIGFNSTTILESGLRNIPVIIPAFDEVTKKYKDYFNLEKYKKVFNVVNKKNFISIIKIKLRKHNVSKNNMKKRWELFNEYVSPTNSNSKIKTILALKKII